MQKWEHKFVECVSHLEEWYPAFEDGQEIAHWKTGGNVTAYSNGLGDQGWELVNFSHCVAGLAADHREFLWLAFKRPKA